MNRRGFLGFLGAGAAAGPKMAGELATGLASEAANVPIPPMGGLVGGQMGSSMADAAYHADRISRLKAIISGNDPGIKRERAMHRLYMAESMERFRLDGLRSVSAASKMRMFIDGNHERQQRIRKQNAKFDLAELLREKLPF